MGIVKKFFQEIFSRENKKEVILLRMTEGGEVPISQKTEHSSSGKSFITSTNYSEKPEVDLSSVELSSSNIGLKKKKVGIKKQSKTELVRNHLQDYKFIDSWAAITLYKATRLSSIIYNLRYREGLDIESIIDKSKSHFATYILHEH